MKESLTDRKEKRMANRRKRERQNGERFRICITESPLTGWDYVLFVLLAVVCFFCFQHGDILHTAGSSFGYLDGHFFDFYDYNTQYGIWDSYMPSSYWMFAIWNIPLKVLGIVPHPTQIVPVGVLMWYKLLPVTLYMISGYFIYKICMEIGMGSKKSKICTYAFYTTPIGFFSQFIFGQYDIFTLFFMLIGIYYYFKGKDLLFILFFSFSVPFKYFSLLVFFPLLLLKEKNVWKILQAVILVVIPYALELLIYYPSEVFREYVLGFQATSYIFEATIELTEYSISYSIVIFALVCAWAYFTNVQGRTDWAEWAFFLSGLAIFVAFGISRWHPQWLLMGMPFFLISAFLHKDTKVWMILDILLMLVFSIYVVNYWKDRVDQFLLSNALFKNIYQEYNVGSKVTMRALYKMTDMDLIMSMFSGLMLIMAIFKHPKQCLRDVSTNISDCIGWIRTRFLLGVGIFVIPAFICLIVSLVPPYVTTNTGHPTTGAGLITSGVVMEQHFIAKKDYMAYITFRVGTYKRTNHSSLEVKLKDGRTDEVLAEETFDVSHFGDNDWQRFDCGNIRVTPGREYYIEFSSSDADAGNSITLYRTAEKGNAYGCFAQINDVEQEFQICVKVFENERKK